MRRRTIRLALLGTAFVTLAAVPSGQDINSFKGGVRVAAATCATFPAVSSTSITTALGDLKISNVTQAVKVTVVCHLPVPEGAAVRRFAVTGKVGTGEIFAFLHVREATNASQGLLFAPLTLIPSTPFEIPDQQQRVVTDLPPSGTESLTITRTRAHFIDATVTTKTPVPEAQALRLFYFEVYWD